MSEPKPKPKRPTAEEMDERLVVPLDPEEALRALLKVDPDSEPVENDEGPAE